MASPMKTLDQPSLLSMNQRLDQIYISLEIKRRKTVPEESMPWIETSIIEEELLQP
jgi:hypothetical protein